MFDLQSPEYSGIYDAIAKPSTQHDNPNEAEENCIEREEQEIEDDLDGEQEAFGFPIIEDEYARLYEEEASDEEEETDSEEDNADGARTTTTSAVNNIDLNGMKKVIAQASKGVIEATDASYRRLITQCEKFMHDKGFIPKDNFFFSPTPVADSAAFIVAWIMSECDNINLDGTAKSSNQVSSSYSHAQKMRAAATYGFGRIADLGSRPWEQIDSFDASGTRTWCWVGNPSVSEAVSRYMITLRKKKVRAGEVATSARAITPVRL
ncbi:hypothetical protein MIND_00204400 [Mycena indigotica]|uniref:Uncharacterized protein n=1 Tax=Mycena indigotica TaxID=2126181 RepID=A0A8H6T4H5_9AGAR|nr:uncharacterized protein MIND_00204400 [Mycena indigotica]KAF7311930.1 hypothetical protein MIND_00204400 [Mycena indigotica]